VESGGDEPSGNTHFLNITDTKDCRLVGNITLPGSHSEGMAVDHAGRKLYVNNSATNEVIEVDLETRQVIAKWPVPEVQALNGMALDELNHRLFVATRKPPKFFVFDTDTAKW
jgi:DNA-binding beta-propeller fold protein YncE